MNNLNEKLSEALEIQPLEIKQSTEIVEIKDVLDDDAEFARQNIRDLIVKGNDAASHIVEIAKQSEHPRAFEVYATLLKNMTEANDRLLRIQKEMRDISGVKKESTTTNIDKAIFVGSTSELSKLLKSKD